MKEQNMSSIQDSSYRDRLKGAEAAAAWLMRLETEGAGCRTEFADWLKESPQNVHDFLAVSAWLKRVNEMDPAKPIEADPVLAAIRPRTPGDVVTLSRSSGSKAGKQKRPLRWAAAIAAAGILTALAIAPDGPVYTTALGEQRSLKLPDGSLIVLNTRSRVEVDFSPQTRDVKLLEGEVLFTVTQDAARPFRVVTNSAVIQALGTQFNVRRAGANTVVSVVEGRVRISEAGTTAVTAAQVLKAGEQAHMAKDKSIVRRKDGDTAAAVAWRERRLVFRDESLADIASEFNRYNETQIQVKGESVRNRRLTGAFDADNPQSLLLFFQDEDSLTIERKPGVLVIGPADSAGH
jgi:transmembrane sensor